VVSFSRRTLLHGVSESIFKNSDRLITSNYRPVSLLTSFSKAFEKLTFARFYKDIFTNNILSNVHSVEQKSIGLKFSKSRDAQLPS